MNTGSFEVYIKTKDNYRDIAKEVNEESILEIKNQTDHYQKEGTKM